MDKQFHQIQNSIWIASILFSCFEWYPFWQLDTAEQIWNCLNGWLETGIRGHSYYVLLPIFFGGKYDLIQLHRQIIHQNSWKIDWNLHHQHFHLNLRKTTKMKNRFFFCLTVENPRPAALACILKRVMHLTH